MEEIIETEWNGGMSFKSEVDGHTLIMDAAGENGGKDKGPRPKPLLLAALSGCSGMDVVSILGKMKVDLDKFSMKATGDQTDDHPKYYRKIHLIYEFSGKDLPVEKLEKAIKLSLDKYCGVHKMLQDASEISWEIKING